MQDVKTFSKERELRGKLAAGSLGADDCKDLASILYGMQRFEEAIDVLRSGLKLQFGGPARAALLTLLGWYVNVVTHTTDEPLALGEEAVAITAGLHTTEALLARARAMALVAVCAWQNPDYATDMAMSALSLLEGLLRRDGWRDSMATDEAYGVHLESARLNCLLGRFEEAARHCAEALPLAKEENDKLSCLTELGTIYHDSGQLEEARRAFAMAVSIQTAAPFGLVRPYYELGLTESALGKSVEARAKIQKALGILQGDPALPRGYIPELLRAIGYISYEIGDIDEAARSFRAAVDAYSKEDPFHWSCLLWLAHCQFDAGQFEAAQKSAGEVKQSPLVSEDDRANADALLRGAALSMPGPS